MLVKDIMTKRVVAIDPDMPIRDVHALMEQRNIRHFPILEGERLVGIVSDRDIRFVGSELPTAKRGVTLRDAVRSIMVSDVITAHPLDPVEEAAKLLRERKIGAMPVLDDLELVGIVTGIDFLEALVRMTGVFDAASRLEVEVENRPGALAALTGAIGARNVNISSVLTTARDENSLTFVLRVNTIDARGLAAHLEREGFTVVWPPPKQEP
jgi:acetoin utilization protein AcuB